LSASVLRGAFGHRLGADHPAAQHAADVVERARVLRGRGTSYRIIGYALGVSQWTVRDWCEGRTRDRG